MNLLIFLVLWGNVMKQKLLKRLLTAMAVIISLSFSTATAQNFVSEGTSQAYNASCKGVIKMKSATGTFVNTGTTANLGQGESGNPIDGTVDYGAIANGQAVPGFYYTRLVLTGGNKDVADGVRITGTECATPLSAYPDLANYPYYETVTNVSYTGTFYYVGTGPASQTIYPQYSLAGGQPNNYAILDLSGGGPKDILAGDEIGASAVNSATGTSLSIAGVLNTGTGTSTLAGLVTLDNAAAEFNVGNGDVNFNGNLTVNTGTLAVTGTGDAIIGATSTLNLVGTSSVVNLAANTDLVVTGTFTNGGDGTNLDFDCASNVTYNGTSLQSIVPTIASNAYGNLIMSASNKQSGTSSYGSNIHLCTNFSLSNGNLDMKNATTSGTLYMTSVAVNPNYGYALNGTTVTGTHLEEVYGQFVRTNGTAGTTALPNTMLRFNNANTEVTLASAANNPKSMEFGVRVDVMPFNHEPTKDLDRKVNLQYAGNTADFTYALKVGYNFNDFPWTATNTQTTVRMYESDASSTGVEKIGTGQVPTRGSAVDGSALGYVSIAGIGNAPSGTVPNGLGIFESGNDVLLRTGPTTFYTVASGRWTNPNTWDEGAIPQALDDAEIRHSVYVGIDAPFINTHYVAGDGDNNSTNNTKSEKDAYPSNVAAANRIEIASGFDKAALIMGNEDNGDGYVFWTTYTGAGYSFTNSNSTAPTVNYGSLNLDKSTYNSGSVFNGVWLTEYVGATGPTKWYPILRTNNFLNKGTVNNDGVIEVGN